MSYKETIFAIGVICLLIGGIIGYNLQAYNVIDFCNETHRLRYNWSETYYCKPVLGE